MTNFVKLQFRIVKLGKDIGWIQAAHDTDLHMTFVNAMMNIQPVAVHNTVMTPLSMYLSQIQPSIAVRAPLRGDIPFHLLK
jgi:selenophosphate synthase